MGLQILPLMGRRLVLLVYPATCTVLLSSSVLHFSFAFWNISKGSEHELLKSFYTQLPGTKKEHNSTSSCNLQFMFRSGSNCKWSGQLMQIVRRGRSSL